MTDGPADQRAIELALDQVILGTGLHDLGFELGVAMPGEHDDGRFRRQFLHAGDRRQASGIGQGKVEQDQIRHGLEKLAACLGERVDHPQPRCMTIETRLAQESCDQRSITRIVFDQENLQGHGRLPGRRTSENQ